MWITINKFLTAVRKKNLLIKHFNSDEAFSTICHSLVITNLSLTHLYSFLTSSEEIKLHMYVKVEFKSKELSLFPLMLCVVMCIWPARMAFPGCVSFPAGAAARSRVIFAQPRATNVSVRAARDPPTIDWWHETVLSQSPDRGRAQGVALSLSFSFCGWNSFLRWTESSPP